MSELVVGDYVEVTGWPCPSRGQKGKVLDVFNKYSEVNVCRVKLESGRVLEGIASSYLTKIEKKEKSVSKFKGMKFRVGGPDHSKILQEVLFQLGYRWYAQQHPHTVNTSSKYLYANIRGYLSHGSIDPIFDNHEYCEFDVSWMLHPRETVEIAGKAYYKDEVQALLDEHCTPVDSTD